MKKTTLVLMLAFSFMVAQPVHAAVPKLMTYQGVLKDSSGNFLTGTYSMTFRIYSASTGGTSLWSETQSNVSTSSGKFSVQLGSVTTLSLDFNSDYWLSIQVGSDAEMSPRVRLTAMGYSFRTDYEVNGFTQAQHDALSHKNIEGVKDNTVHIAKTNFKVDAYSIATANSMGDLIVDVLNDSNGINSGASSNYSWRGSSNYDVVATSYGGGIIQQYTSESEPFNLLKSNETASYNGVGQKFQHTAQVTVDKVVFKWQRNGSPTGNVRIRLYSDSSGVPGTLLAESSDISVASVSTSSVEVSTTFTPVTLSANTPYHVVLENIDGSGSSSNYMKVRGTISDGYSSGLIVLKSSGGTWAAQSAGYGDCYFKVYEQVAYNTATVISNVYSVTTAPTEAMVISDETLGTGSITYSVSRDNGTTWTQCTKETVTNISSQPSGTQVKWKASITGNAELNAIAVAV